MRIPSTLGGRVALVVTILGTVLLVVGAFLTFHNPTPDAATAESGASGTEAFVPYDGETPESLEDLLNPAKQGTAGGTSGTDNPFSNTGGDTRFHNVTITLTSDGAMYVGYRFRDGGSDLKVADRSMVVTKRMRGPLPVAQVAVQVLNTATFATCAISVDGVTVTRATAKGQNQVVVCTG